MNKAVIIHLSDIHFDGLDESNHIMNNLIDDLTDMKKYVGQYDLLTITGDCVDKGKVDLFNLFSKKLNELIRKNDLKANKIVIVPGNHDVSHENSWLVALKESQKSILEINRRMESDYAAIFREYNDFVKKYQCPDNGFGVKYYTCNGLVIRIIFINSSWSTLTNNKYGDLIIGEKQLEYIKGKLTNKKYDYTIACMHHPLDWFTFNDRIRIQKFLYDELKVDFLFHGHIHEASYDSINNMDNNTSIFCTGISYHKTGENCSRKDGMRYSIYEIDKDTHTVNIYLRATNEQGVFVGDNRLYTKVNKDGFFTIPIGNITECLLPLSNASQTDKSFVFTNRNFVELLLHKEEYLFRYYCKMEKIVDQLLQKGKLEEFINKKKKGRKKIKQSEKREWEKEFYKEQFEYYCMFVLNDLNALFFERHKDVRLLLRRYNPRTNEHIAVFAEGVHSSLEEIDKVKKFTWGEGMIYASYKSKSALLMSKNIESHINGNSKGVWKDYLTIAIGGIEVKGHGGQVPLFALNIATESFENERCLQALALSSIYDKIQEVFKLFQTRAMDLAEIYDI